MSNNILTEFQQQEAETTALQVKFNRWSLVMIELMIREQEETGRVLALSRTFKLSGIMLFAFPQNGSRAIDHRIQLLEFLD